MLEAMTAMNSENVTQSDSTVIDPPFKYLLITKAGTVTIKNEKDQSVLITIDASITSAVLVPGRVRKVMDTGTSVSDANILGIR